MNTKIITFENVTPHVFARLAQMAGVSIQNVFLKKDQTTIDAKSILGIFSLGINSGDTVTISSDDAAILDKIASALESDYLSDSFIKI